MTTDDGYADWLRSNPAPDLQVLVGCHGGYDKITPEAWAEYDRPMADWHERRRTRRVVVRGEGADRDALCICGLPGVYWRPRKGGGHPIWRCQQHRNLWPDYAEDIPLKEAAE